LRVAHKVIESGLRYVGISNGHLLHRHAVCIYWRMTTSTPGYRRQTDDVACATIVANLIFLLMAHPKSCEQPTKHPTLPTHHRQPRAATTTHLSITCHGRTNESNAKVLGHHRFESLITFIASLTPPPNSLVYYSGIHHSLIQHTTSAPAETMVRTDERDPYSRFGAMNAYIDRFRTPPHPHEKSCFKTNTGVPNKPSPTTVHHLPLARPIEALNSCSPPDQDFNALFYLPLTGFLQHLNLRQ